MRNTIIVLALLASSCVTGRVQNEALLPAIEQAWPGVRADAEVGGMNAPALESWDRAVETHAYVGLDVLELEAAALFGIDTRLINGEIGPHGASIMRDRARSFRAAVEEYLTPALASVSPTYRQRPLVISRSSWATSPPPAIAGRTYR